MAIDKKTMIAVQLATIAEQLRQVSEALIGEGAEWIEKREIIVQKPCFNMEDEKAKIAPLIKKPQSVSYDTNPASPTYDPPPPYEVHRVPERGAFPVQEQIIIKADTAIRCRKCNTAVMYATEDIKASRISGDMFETGVEGWDIHNVPFYKGKDKPGLSCDCPVCKGDKSVVLFGDGPEVKGGLC